MDGVADVGLVDAHSEGLGAGHHRNLVPLELVGYFSFFALPLVRLDIAGRLTAIYRDMCPEMPPETLRLLDDAVRTIDVWAEHEACICLSTHRPEKATGVDPELARQSPQKTEHPLQFLV